MNSFDKAVNSVISGTFVNLGLQNKQSRSRIFESLLTNKRLPQHSLSDETIAYILSELANLDSNNFYNNVGVGEREGRVYSKVVANAHYNLSHGIGRSGDLSEVQPKAAGSSALYKLTNYLTMHALQLAGFHKSMQSCVIPLATGMSLMMCFLALKLTSTPAKFVIWSRIDQKSCFKSIVAAGLVPIVVDQLNENGRLVTDIAGIRNLLNIHGPEILCVVSTTSCFAPRQPDLVDEIAVLCKLYNVNHIINNAYGLQCESVVKLINRAVVKGTVTAGLLLFCRLSVFCLKIFILFRCSYTKYRQEFSGSSGWCRSL